MVISVICLVPVRLLRPSMAVLYHENGKLQRVYYTVGYTQRQEPPKLVYPSLWDPQKLYAISYSHFCNGEGEASFIFISEREYTCYLEADYDINCYA